MLLLKQFVRLSFHAKLTLSIVVIGTIILPIIFWMSSSENGNNVSLDASEMYISNNQQGGFTGKIEVNQGTSQRHLDATSQKILSSNLPGDRRKTIEINAMANSIEATTLANEIWMFVKTFGFENVELNQAIFTPPLAGVEFNWYGNKFVINVGSPI